MKIGIYDLKTVIIPLMGTNCHFLCLDSKAILVDAGGDGSTVLDFIKSNNLDLVAVFLTYGHFDHIEALDVIYKEFPKIKLYMCEKEKVVVDNLHYNLMDHLLKEETRDAINYIDDKTLDDVRKQVEKEKKKKKMKIICKNLKVLKEEINYEILVNNGKSWIK